MRMQTFKTSDADRAARAQVKAWTRAHFGLADDETVAVSEIACSLPGCPPRETVVAFWTADNTRHQFKVFKAVADVSGSDLPPSWLKASLAVDEEADAACC